MPTRPRRTDPADLIRYFSERVRHFRNLRGLSQSDLAADSRIPATTISRIEHGRANARLDTIAKLASALRIKPSELLP
jgi:transcriptional regulator with XRE-family HTH domain